MNNLDEYKCLVESYFGIMSLDEYDLKEYELKKLKKIIDDYSKENNISDEISNDIINNVKTNSTFKRNLQSCLITYSSVDAPIDLIILIKRKLKSL